MFFLPDITWNAFKADSLFGYNAAEIYASSAGVECFITPDGETQVNIPAGTAPGCNLRLRGKGWPIKNGRGDLIFTLKLQIPEQWSSKELDLIHELQRMRCNDPRKSWLQSARL